MSAQLDDVMVTDPTAGMELVTGDEIALEATRHLFLAGDLLDPARKRDISLPNGGEELANRCLRRTSGKLPRCAITPLEFWGEALPLDQFPEGVRPYRIKGAESTVAEPVGGGTFGTNIRRANEELFMIPVFPGEQIHDAIGLATGERRGIVEIEVLRGIDYGGADREMQNLFFGDWPLPIELRLIEERINRIAESVADPDVHAVAANFLDSCAQFREYALDRIGLENTQMQLRVLHRHVYRYSPKVRSFAAQLEIQLQIGPGERIIGQVDKAVSAISPEQMAAASAAGLADLGKVIADAVTQAIAAATRPAPPVEQPAPPAAPVGKASK